MITGINSFLDLVDKIEETFFPSFIFFRAELYDSATLQWIRTAGLRTTINKQATCNDLTQLAWNEHCLFV